MKKMILPLLVILALGLHAQDIQKVLKIHQKAILVDTHNDALSNQLITGLDLSKQQTVGNLDLPRAKQGGLDVQVFSVWCDGSYGTGKAYAFANREIDSLYALINRNPGKMILAHNLRELKKGVRKKEFVAMIGVEGGHMIEDRIDYIDSLAKRGMKYMTLTWNNSTTWATSAADETHRKAELPHIGLTDFGKQIVHHMNDLGVMVDVSHVGEQTFYDVLATTTKPVIASHSCAYALNPNQRNLKDDQLKAIAKNGGVVFVNFYSGFVDSTYARKAAVFMRQHRIEIDSLMKIYNDRDLANMRLSAIHPAESAQIRAPLSMLIKHIDYMVKMIGADHVGIGSDFDGSESFPLGLDDVRDYPKVTEELLKLNYSKSDIYKILGGNFIRVLKENEKK
jgi:membrane dipeptidase